MNLYQTLNQDLREFRMKKSLLEAEETKKTEEEIKETEVPAEETPVEEPEVSEDEIARRLVSLSEQLDTASEDEIGAIELEINELKNKLNEISATRDLASDEVEDVKVTDAEETEVEENTEVLEEVPTEEPKEDEEDEEVTVESLLDEIATACDSEEGCDCEKVKELVAKAKELLNPVTEEPTEEVEEVTPEDLTECEITNYKVVRVAPSTGAYMIEAQTKEGIKFITGKNFNEESKTLDEAEISDSKSDATNRFKSLLENK